MDIESFGQCLSYFSATSQKKSALEMLLPYGGALVGVFVGFLVNIFRDGYRDRRAIKNKKMCIKEDVHRLRFLLERSASESMKVMNMLFGHNLPAGHNLPNSFKMPLLDEYFSEVAYTYTVKERYLLKELSSYVSVLEGLREQWTGANGKFELSVAALEILNTGAHCVGMCDVIFNSKKPRGLPEDLLESLEFDNSDLLIYESVRGNVESKNTILKL